MLLGLRGMMSEAELHVLQSRMHEGKLNKARRGELLGTPPIGYVKLPTGEFALDPDDQVRAVVRLCYGRTRNQLRYTCSMATTSYAEPTCQSVAGRPLDDAITAQVLAALTPAGLDISLRAAADLQGERDRLAADLPAVWAAPTTTPADRQRVIRCLVERVTAAVDKGTERVRVVVRWSGGCETGHDVRRPVEALGGISAIAISHPHYYSSMVEWSRAFGGVPIHLHAADRRWVTRPDEAIDFWEGETKSLGEGLTLIRCGGHFEGGTVLHWQRGADGKGALLTGDIIQVVADRTHVSFMYSYPNYVPLSASAVERIVRAVEPFGYDRVYGAFWDTVIGRDGTAAVARSAERYRRAISGE